MRARGLQGTTKEEFFGLLQKINNNPHDGLQEFYEKYSKLITNTASIFFKNKFVINEVVNDVLIKIWKKSKKPCVIEKPEGWIYIITANCAKSLLRRRRYMPLEETIKDKKDGIQDFIDLDSFYFMIKDLSQAEQQIIIQRCVSSFTFEEIAEIVGKKTSTVSSTFYRSMDKIKEKIKKFTKDA
ncbi:MAG: sigma-70 family RNA polymerase sigma factor [Clostridia bacterium]|nr:sigma-70 family RNA polymerase sigma factor [Clostridia bacterium]